MMQAEIEPRSPGQAMKGAFFVYHTYYSILLFGFTKKKKKIIYSQKKKWNFYGY